MVGRAEIKCVLESQSTADLPFNTATPTRLLIVLMASATADYTVLNSIKKSIG